MTQKRPCESFVPLTNDLENGGSSQREELAEFADVGTGSGSAGSGSAGGQDAGGGGTGSGGTGGQGTESRGPGRPWSRISPASVGPLGAAAAERAGPEVRAIRRELAAWIREAREWAGRSPKEVARAMGYRSLERGMSRLARWERGEEGVWADRIPLLAAALGRRAEELARFGERELDAMRDAREKERIAEEHQRRIRQEDRKAEEAEENLLGRHAQALIQRLPKDAGLDSLPDVTLWTAGWSIMMLGGGDFSLHTLVRAWQRDLLTLVCHLCGGPLRLFWVSGSPFSGANRLRGICQRTGLCHTGRKPEGESLARLVWCVLEKASPRRPGSQEPRSERDLPSGGEDRAACVGPPGPSTPPRYDLTLAEVCGLLGLDVPVVRIRHASGEPMALFDPSTGVITPLGPFARGAGVDRVARAEPEHLTLRVSRERGAAKEGGRIVIGSLVPLTFGARGRSCQHLVDAEGRSWRLFAGHLENAEGQAVAWFDGPVPPGVAGWVVAAVSTGGARQEEGLGKQTK